MLVAVAINKHTNQSRRNLTMYNVITPAELEELLNNDLAVFEAQLYALLEA